MTTSSALQALAALALYAAATPAWAADPAVGIRAHVRDVHSIHQRNGMAGLEVASRAQADLGGAREERIHTAQGCKKS